MSDDDDDDDFSSCDEAGSEEEEEAATKAPDCVHHPTPRADSVADYASAWPRYGGGGLPHTAEPPKLTGSWCELSDGAFRLRGKTYLADQIKQPSAATAFAILSITGVDADECMLDVGHRFAPLAAFLSAQSSGDFLVNTSLFIKRIPAPLK